MRYSLKYLEWFRCNIPVPSTLYIKRTTFLKGKIHSSNKPASRLINPPEKTPSVKTFEQI